MRVEKKPEEKWDVTQNNPAEICEEKNICIHILFW